MILLPKVGIVLIKVRIVETKDELATLHKEIEGLKTTQPKDVTAIVIPSEIIETEQLTESEIRDKFKEDCR